MISKEDLIGIFKNYLDPELGIDIWTMGLIRDFKIGDDNVEVVMTFTSPMCPLGPQIVNDLKGLIRKKGAKDVEIKVTFDPPWQPSEELRKSLGV